MKRWWLPALLVVLAGAVAGCSSKTTTAAGGGGGGGGASGTGFAIGQMAPEISGEDIDGKPMKLSDYRGKVVVLDFWGNW